MSKFSLEVYRRIYDDEDGVHLEVGPDSDGLDMVQLRTGQDKESQEYYGNMSLCMVPQQARLVAAALNLAADEAEARSNAGA